MLSRKPKTAKNNSSHVVDGLDQMGSRTRLSDLHLAAYKGDVQSVRHHIDAGCDVNAECEVTNAERKTMTGVTAMYLAAQRGHYDVCKMLFRAGADPNRPVLVPSTGARHTPAEVALAFGSWKLWWFLSQKRFIKTYKGGSQKGPDAKQYRKLEDDMVHAPDQAGNSALIF